jgi:hypothetical protein
MIKEVAMAYFKIIFQHLPETSKENHKKPQDCTWALECDLNARPEIY